jgi:hypothetical protein
MLQHLERSFVNSLSSYEKLFPPSSLTSSNGATDLRIVRSLRERGVGRPLEWMMSSRGFPQVALYIWNLSGWEFSTRALKITANVLTKLSKILIQ